MKTISPCAAAPAGTPARERIDPAALGPGYGMLLDNRALTTDLLEGLTGAQVGAEAFNRIRKERIFRISVLTGAGDILLFARCLIDPSCLPGEAHQSLLTGQIPLGRILRQYGLQTVRHNFTFFAIADQRRLVAMFRPLLPVSPSFRRWVDRASAPHRRAAAPIAASAPSSPVRPGAERFFGRAYQIDLRHQRLARIEEIYPPGLSFLTAGFGAKGEATNSSPAENRFAGQPVR